MIINSLINQISDLINLFIKIDDIRFLLRDFLIIP